MSCTRRVLFVLTTALLLFSLPATADVRVELRDGTSLTFSSVQFTDDMLVPSEGDPIPREQIAEIQYMKGDRGWRYEPTPPDSANYAHYLEIGKQLAAEFPGYSFYTVEDENIFTVNSDGTTSRMNRMVQYIAKEDGKRLASVGLGVDPQRDREVIKALRSISPDLVVRDVDPATITMKQTNTSSKFFNRYTSISANIPGAEIGGLIETNTGSEVYNPFDPQMWQDINFHQSSNPVARSVYTVRVPKGTPLNFYAQNMPENTGEPVKRTIGDRDEYTWETGRMEPFVSEPYMPPQAELVAMVVVSPFFDYQPIFDFDKKMIDSKTEPNEFVRQVAAKVTEGATTDDEKVARIYHFVQRNIRYISIKGGIGSGWGGHAAWTTLQNHYGDCIDKAIVMKALLSAVNIEADVASIMTNGGAQMIEKLPVLWANHAITRVTLNGKSFYLDSTANMYRYPSFRSDDYGSVAMLEGERKLEKIPYPEPSENAVTVDSDIVMDESGGFDLTRTTTAVGPKEATLRYHLTGIKPKTRKESLLQAARLLSADGTVVDYEDIGVDDLASPIKSRVWMKLPDYCRKTGNYYYFKLPGLTSKFPQIELAKRIHPLKFSVPYAAYKTYRVQLPAGFKIEALPKPLNISDPLFSAKATYKLSGNTLTLDYQLKHRAGEVPLARYDEYRNKLLEVERYTNQSIFLINEKGGVQ